MQSLDVVWWWFVQNTSKRCFSGKLHIDDTDHDAKKQYFNLISYKDAIVIPLKKEVCISKRELMNL